MNDKTIITIKSMSVRLSKGEPRELSALCQAGIHRPSIGSPSAKAIYSD